MVAGLAVLNHTLTPRMKAAHVAIESMKGHLDAVYDITVAYEGTMDASGHRTAAPSMPGNGSTCFGTDIVFDALKILHLFTFILSWFHNEITTRAAAVGTHTAVIWRVDSIT